MREKLIVIEGLDGSGKSTQVNLLIGRLTNENIPHKKIKLPNYDDPACELVKEYLAGRFGSEPADVNAFAASTFYAVDRYVSFNCIWKQDYLAGKLIIADRYTTSNAYHQITKLKREEWNDYLEWLEDFEYKKLAIPKPSEVIYLDVPVELSQSLLSDRYSGNDNKKDIHEKNIEYLKKCREAALYVAEKLNWHVVNCVENNKMTAAEKINDKIYDFIKK